MPTRPLASRHPLPRSVAGRTGRAAAVALAATVAAAWAVAAGCAAPPPPDPANVVVVSVDTLSRDALGVYEPSAPALPHLDRFAARAAVFTDALTPAPWTLPAQASLLTGLYPDRHGATELRQKIHDGTPTLAGALHQAGLETVAFTDGGYVHPWFGFAAGFEHYDGLETDGGDPTGRGLPRDGKPAEVHGSALFDRGIAYLRQRRPEDPPFFLFLQTYAVHDYFKLHPWAVGTLSGPPPEPSEHYQDCNVGKQQCSAEEWRLLKTLYRAEHTHLDAAFGRLLDALDESGLAATTLVLFTSDHGEGFDPGRGRIHHGGRLHEDQLRVPLLVAGPGIAPGNRDAPASLLDVAPTLIELLGAAPPLALDGVSLASALGGGGGDPQRARYAMDHFHWWQDGERMASPEVRDEPIVLSVVKRDLWYIRGPDGGEELYDMSRDPRQTSDLTADSTRLGQMRGLAAAWKSDRPRLEPLDVDPRLLEELMSLGYLQ